jgi:hypothetical protein
VLGAVETVLNDRPLTYISEDQDDLIPLTSYMFLHQQVQSSFPEAAEIDFQGVQRAVKVLGKLREELRERFRREYLSQLIHRGKAKDCKKLLVGDIVLVGADQKKRLLWPMGRIVELLPGADGKVRVAKVQVKDSVLVRPLQRLYPMEISTPAEVPAIASRDEEEVIVGEEPGVITWSGRHVKVPQRYESE